MWQDMNLGFSLQSTGDLYVDTDVQAIRNSLRNILLTLPGSRRRNAKFAFGIQKYLEEYLDNETFAEVKSQIHAYLLKFEDRAVITDIIIQKTDDEKGLYVQINFYPVNQEEQLATLSFILKG